MKLGFIGMGNMAYAILKGGHDAGFFAGSEVYAYDPNTDRLAQVAAETGIRPCGSGGLHPFIGACRCQKLRLSFPHGHPPKCFM